MFDLCVLFMCQWLGREDEEVLVNNGLTVQTETFGARRVTMIKNAAHTGVLGILGEFQHKPSSKQPTSELSSHNEREPRLSVKNLKTLALHLTKL